MPLQWFCTMKSPESGSDMLGCFSLWHTDSVKKLWWDFLYILESALPVMHGWAGPYRWLQRSRRGLTALIPLLQTYCWTILPFFFTWTIETNQSLNTKLRSVQCPVFFCLHVSHAASARLCLQCSTSIHLPVVVQKQRKSLRKSIIESLNILHWERYIRITESISWVISAKHRLEKLLNV